MVSIKHFYVERKQGGRYTILIRIVIRAIVPPINIRNSRNRYLIFFYTALKNTHLYTDITDYFSSKKKKKIWITSMKVNKLSTQITFRIIFKK